MIKKGHAMNHVKILTMAPRRGTCCVKGCLTEAPIVFGEKGPESIRAKVCIEHALDLMGSLPGVISEYLENQSKKDLGDAQMATIEEENEAFNLLCLSLKGQLTELTATPETDTDTEESEHPGKLKTKPNEPLNLNDFTMTQLKSMAKEMSLEGYSNKPKEDLITLISSALNTPGELEQVKKEPGQEDEDDEVINLDECSIETLRDLASTMNLEDYNHLEREDLILLIREFLDDDEVN